MKADKTEVVEVTLTMTGTEAQLLKSVMGKVQWKHFYETTKSHLPQDIWNNLSQVDVKAAHIEDVRWTREEFRDV